MIERFEIPCSFEESKELIEVTNWAWNSHWWVELSPGYCECKWCGAKHTSEIPIAWDFPLCKENLAVKNFMAKILKSKNKEG